MWPLLAHSADPGARTAALQALAPLGVDPNTIVERLFADEQVERNSFRTSPFAPRKNVLSWSERDKLAGTLRVP